MIENQSSRVAVARATWVTLCACGLAASVASALPPSSITVPFKTSNNVVGVGTINSIFLGGANGDDGFRGFASNDTGAYFVHAGIFANPGFDQAVLDQAGGLAVPYLAAGAEFPADGSVSVPSTDYVLNVLFSMDMNAAGNGAFIVHLGPGEFSSVTPITGVMFNKSAMPVKEGDPVTAAGVAPGTVFAEFGNSGVPTAFPTTAAPSVVHINDSNTLLLGTQIIESGVHRNAIIKVQLDGSGTQVSQTLVAKEGGPVGAGPDTWATLSIGAHTMAMNNVGQVIFSGITAGGTNGVFLNNAFVAQQGGPSPIPGNPWGSIAGAPVDINSAGAWALRGPALGADFWNEQADAGENFGSTAGGGPVTGNVTSGGGPLHTISGSLSNDFDVDVYQILVGDPTLPSQQAFSATTVPDPGSGFAGANFDSVLYLFAFNTQNNGNTRVGVGRCDDAAPGVMQSTLTAASLPTNHAPGQIYFLAVATPKARPQNREYAFPSYADLWQGDPGEVAVAGGIAYWVEPGTGRIGRADTATGSALPPLQVGSPPQQIPANPQPNFLDAGIAVYSAGASSKIVFFQHGSESFRTCNLDGSGAADLPTTPNGFGLTAFTVDSANGKLYFAKTLPGDPQVAEIYRCDLDGNNPETVATINDPASTSNSSRIESISIDTQAPGKVCWVQTVYSVQDAPNGTYLQGQYIRRANLDGTNPETLATGAGATSITIVSAARKLYYTANALDKVGVIDLTSLADSPLVTTTTPQGVAVDAGAGMVYWTNPADRFIRRSAIAAPAVQNWLNIGPDVGETPADGPADTETCSRFARTGTAGTTALPYQIRLTGATFAVPLTVISRSGSKVVATGDVLASTAPDGVSAIGGLNSPVKITDNGLVAWRGRWTSTVAPTGTRTALFLGDEIVFRDDTSAPGIGNAAGPLVADPYGFNVSPNGQYVLAHTVIGSWTGAGDNCLRVAFDSPPTGPCPADFNGSGAVTVQDIFDFLAAYFTQSPAADINASGGVTVQDIFDYLALYFAGCA